MPTPQSGETVELEAMDECWLEVTKLIKIGPLPGNGWDAVAERNGLVLAANVIAALRDRKKLEKRGAMN